MISCPESWQALLGLSMLPGVHVKICLFVDVLSLWKGVDNLLIEQLSLTSFVFYSETGMFFFSTKQVLC
jgi:hypothetical protein